MVLAARRPYEVTLNGVPYRVDLARYRRQTVPPVRPQVDQRERTGEGSIAQTGLWRSTQVDFSGGAGQANYDLTTSDPTRYFASVGVNPFVSGRLGQYQALSLRASFGPVATNCAQLFNMSSRLALVNDTRIDYSDADFLTPTFANVALPFYGRDAASDGRYVWVCYGVNNGISTWDSTSPTSVTNWTTSAQQVGTQAWRMIAFAGGRLFVGASTGGSLQEVSSSGALTLLYTHPRSTQFLWRKVVAGPDGYYAFGNLQRSAEVYRFTVNQSTGGLNQPQLVASFQNEAVFCMAWVGDYAFIGTSKGFRIAQNDGNRFVYGPVVRYNQGKQNAIACCAVDGRHVVFGWGLMRTNSSESPLGWGVGRVDMGRFTRPLVPAYCAAEAVKYDATGTYLLAIHGGTGTNLVPIDWAPPTSIAMVNGWPFVTANGLGPNDGNYAYSTDAWYPPGSGGGGSWIPGPIMYAQVSIGIWGPDFARTLFSPAKLVTSWRTFGISEPKTLTHVAVTTEAILGGELEVTAISGNQAASTSTSLGFMNSGVGTNGAVLLTGPARATATHHRLQVNFTSAAASPGSPNWGPVLAAATMYAVPKVPRVEQITVPLLIGADVGTRTGGINTSDPVAVFNALKDLEVTGTLITYTEGTTTSGAAKSSMTVRIEGVDLSELAVDDRTGWFRGLVTVNLVSVDPLSSGTTAFSNSSNPFTPSGYMPMAIPVPAEVENPDGLY